MIKRRVTDRMKAYVLALNLAFGPITDGRALRWALRFIALPSAVWVPSGATPAYSYCTGSTQRDATGVGVCGDRTQREQAARHHRTHHRDECRPATACTHGT